MSEFTAADSIRILVATDNHVGFEERDPIRKDDSWQSFDEVITLARERDVDMVLLAGDLFHDNKPSRKAMYQVMRTLRKNCLGMKPCELEFLSDPNEIFEGAFNHVNYEDPDINISIPVFSIHGNHDDPSGDGHFCSLDLLQVAGLVNYFGRIPEADKIQARPILLQKGRTKLALYGLSNVRDERMFRTFRDGKVTWFRPNVQQSDWFNLLALHQNHHAHTATGYLPENVLPDWLDLVVWGHEHECLIDPVENPQTGFHVMQPGSSVATSLVPGEAVPKHVAIVTITGREFSVEKIPLKSVRPFVIREIVLATDKRFENLAKKKDNRQELTRRLMAIVDEMIAEANEEWQELHRGDPNAEQPLPLIRLKVEYTAPEGGNFDIENPQRFSNRFVGRVANTNDVVYFHRKKTTTRRRNEGNEVPDDALADMVADEIKVERLVQEYLAAQSLKILPQAPFGDAVSQFVNKDDKHALEAFVSQSLADQVRQMLNLDPDDDNLESAIARYREKMEQQFASGQRRLAARRRYKPKPDDWDSDMDGHWEDQPEAIEQEPTQATNRAASGSARDRERQQSDDEDALMVDAPLPEQYLEVEDEEEEEPPPRPAARGRTATTRATKAAPAKAAPAKKPPARGRRNGKAVVEEEDEEEEADAFVDDGFEPEPPPPPPRQPARRAAAAARATTRAAPQKKATAAPATRSSARPTRQTQLSFVSQQRPTQTAVEISDDEISDDDEFETMPSLRSRRR